MHAGLGRQLHEVESIIAEEYTDAAIDCSPPCGQELPEENFTEVVLLAGLGVGKCHRYKGDILKRECEYGKTKKQWNDINIMAMFTSTLPCHVQKTQQGNDCYRYYNS